MSHIEGAIREMQTRVGEMESAVLAVPEACLTWRPSPEVWSILDNLCHVEEFIPYWMGQIRAMVTRPQEEWGRTHADPDRLAAVADTAGRKREDILPSIHARLDAVCTELLAMDDGMLEIEAPSRNPRWDVKPASFVLDQLLVHHLASHCGQIQRNIHQLQQAD